MGQRPVRFAARALVRGRSDERIVSLLVYLAVSVLLFGLPVLDDPTHKYIGLGPSADAEAYMWFLSWWPHALLEGVNPFITDRLWAPVGVNLTWTNSMPAGSLLVSPVTLLLGPVAAHNVIYVLAPATGAWAAFLLCREVTNAFWPSLAGGYIFGFSSYELGHILGHTSHVPTIFVPLIVLLVVRFLRGGVAPVPFTLLLAGALTLQFLFATEILLTFTLFGAMAFALALLLVRDLRPMLTRITALVAGAYCICAAILSPFLYYLVTRPRNEFQPSEPYSIDLANFVVPTPLAALHHSTLGRLTADFTAGYVESTAYLGLPIIAIVVAYVWRYWRMPVARLLIVILGLVSLASLGPTLRVGGSEVVPSLWWLFHRLPTIGHVLPSRFTLYIFLVAGVIVALWLADRRVGTRLRIAAGLLAVVFLLPDIARPYWKDTPFWKGEITTEPFFTDGLYADHLDRDENVLVFPYAFSGSGMLAQARTDMYYRMAGGYASSAIPDEFWRWPVLPTFFSGEAGPDFDDQFRAFTCGNDVRAVVIHPSGLVPWEALISQAVNSAPEEAGGVSVYRIPWGCP
jgi:hypothetical protein